ncbi:MAG: hypothetical protein ISS16_01395 [Ignavibacteria bacterium]|nr:hypothetical protein [Ignavibacteria bacterium]
MPLKDIPFKKLEPLIRRYLNTEEEEKVKVTIKELKVAKIRGSLTKADLIKVCYFKSPRTINQIKKNSDYKISTVTKKALASRSERIKLELLTSLHGVSVPMASAILMLTNPKRYGVIDIRVWELLYKIGTMKTNPKGVNFSFKEWYRFLVIIRYFAEKFNVKARDIERTLFLVHKDYQKGKLYQNL